jgi:hypothetical protein
VNLYFYVENNPVNLTDPSGQVPEESYLMGLSDRDLAHLYHDYVAALERATARGQASAITDDLSASMALIMQVLTTRGSESTVWAGVSGGLTTGATNVAGFTAHLAAAPFAGTIMALEAAGVSTPLTTHMDVARDLGATHGGARAQGASQVEALVISGGKLVGTTQIAEGVHNWDFAAQQQINDPFLRAEKVVTGGAQAAGTALGFFGTIRGWIRPKGLDIGGGRFPLAKDADLAKTPRGWRSVNVDPTAKPSRVVDIATDPLPYPDGYFPAVEFNHIPYPALTSNALSQAARVLRSGGRLRITTATLTPGRAAFVKAQLEANGVTVDSVSNADGFTLTGTKK